MPADKNLGRLGVVMGGCSSEREISLKSGTAVFSALKEAGCDVAAIDLQTMDESQIIKHLREERVDIVFLVLHGKFGEDGTIQAMLECAGIPYTGSGPQASRLAMDKGATQNLLKKEHIRVPDFVVVEKKDEKEIFQFFDRMGGCPVVVKPSREGSSIGIAMVSDRDSLPLAMQRAFEFGEHVILEKYIAGREITSAILGGQALPLIEIRPTHQFFDFTAKYQKGLTDYLIPAPLNAAQTRFIQEISQSVFTLTGCRDMARSDFLMDDQGQVYFLEINTIPGFTEFSLLPKAARHAGIDFTELCLKLVGFASTRNFTRK